ncbi:MAG: hypothetical protein HY052_00375 [Proteobacteria bacterium]|nr:hypothetical protein [Pseudomonadota bacterium]
MAVKGEIASEFNSQATGKLPKTDFGNYLAEEFGYETAVQVVDVFQKLKLPVPQNSDEFLNGNEGCVVFSNKHGVVLRIEQKWVIEMNWDSDKVPDSPWILKPLASIETDKAKVEICPGCHADGVGKDGAYLYSQLRLQNIDYWDVDIGNFGRLPITSPRFPAGIPVVIDRGAVKKMDKGVLPPQQVKKILHTSPPHLKKKTEVMAADQEATEAQEKLYAPLRQAFEAAWPSGQSAPSDVQKMEQFWTLCERFLQDRKLVVGWNDTKGWKSTVVVETAKHYEERVRLTVEPARSATASNSQSPRPPV